MTFENYIKARLVDVVMFEAFASGGLEPMLAVAQVLKNRVDAGWMGGDWLRVIDAVPERSGIDHPYPPGPLLVDPRDGNFRELLRRVDDVYHGTADDAAVNNESGNSLYYVELHGLIRPWFQDAILSDLESHPRLANVGQLTFFG